jgi:tetratricopeptide (TPR) repeat protein
MKVRFLCLCVLLLSIPAAPAFAQQDKKPAKFPGDKVNAALSQARMANLEKRFQDSETLMLQVTQSYPQLALPWVELGNAQMGLKKYSDAEISFKMAIGMKPDAAKGSGPASTAPPQDKTSEAGAAPGGLPPLGGSSASALPPLGGSSASALPPLGGSSAGGLPPLGGSSAGGLPPLGAASSYGQPRPPEVSGAAYASLGEVYAHEGRIAEAQAAFDEATRILPSDADQYRSNETLVFFQTGHADAQLAAAKQAIALNPRGSYLYYFEGQALVGQATIDAKSQKLILPPECAEAFQKYLKIDPNGRFAADIRGILAAAGVAPGK